MLRTALRPANLGLLVLVLAAAVLFSVLGEWQLGRSQEHARVSPTEVVVPVGDVLQPASDFTGHADHQRVAVSGTWADLPLEVVADRPLDGRDGHWAVAALAVEGTGGLLPVVLGWQPDGAAPPPAPSGGADLTGRLMVSETAQGIGPDGELRVLSSADLVNVWPGRLYTGFLLAEPLSGPPVGSAAGAGAGAGAGGSPLVAVPSEAPTPRLDPQNLSYAFQWWLFAAFGLALWVKIVRDRHHDELADEAAEREELAQPAGLPSAAGPPGERADRGVGGGWEDGGVPDSPTRPEPSEVHR